MSEINKDQEVVQKGRRDALTDVDAPLRDRIVKKLHSKLEELEIPQKVDNLWRGGNANRTYWLKRQQTYLSSWDEHLIADSTGPFEGSSNLHIPMPLIVAKTMHARFFQAIMGSEPPFNTKARNEASQDNLPIVRDTMSYALSAWSNYHKGIEEVVDKWVWAWITTGVGLKKWRWDCTYTRFIDVATVPEQGPPHYSTDANGKEVVQPTVRMVEKEVPVTKKVFEGPVCDYIEPEDLLIIGGGGDPDVADAVLHQQFLTASELWTLADRKIFESDAVADVIEGGPDSVEGSEGSAIKTQRAQNAGQSSLDTSNDLDRYQVLEAYLKVDVDGSGINADIIAWVHPRSRKLLRATYLHRVSKSGERPFVKADFHLRPGQEYGTGLIEMLYPLSREMDAIHNMRIDWGIISVMPFGFYRATSGIDPETISLAPGALIPVDNPQADVYFPNLGNRTVFGFQEEAALQNMIERLTSISDLSLGVIGGQGATRTATGARAVVGEASANLDVYLRRLNRGWKKSLRYLLHTLQQRIPNGLSFRVTGDSGADYWRVIKGEENLAGDFDIEVSPNTASSNAGIQQEVASQILQLTSNPLDIQLGIITAAQRFEALKNYLQSLGVRDYGRFISSANVQGPTRILTPEEEANRVLRGMTVPVTPEMDHEGFINFFQHFYKEDELIGQFSPEQTIELAKQAKRHEQMMQALQAMAAQQANANQMRINAQMSQQQVPNGMNAMAGAGAAGAPAAPSAAAAGGPAQ